MNMKMDRMSQKKAGTKMLLNALETIAEKNAHTLCRGIMYEPKMPEKFKK